MAHTQKRYRLPLLGRTRTTEEHRDPSVWIFCDLPLGEAFGASYMTESWDRELRALGWRSRVVAPSGRYRDRERSDDRLSFRTIRHIGYRGDHRAQFSMAGELWRARKDPPDVVLVTTPLRVGTLGFAIAYYLGVPLVVNVSTDTTKFAEYHSSIRTLATSICKLTAIGLKSARTRKAIFSRIPKEDRKDVGWSAAIAAKVVAAMHGDAAEILLLGERNVEGYVSDNPNQRVSVFPAGVDRLPEPVDPVRIDWRPGALRALYVGRMSPEKTPEILVDAVAEASERGLDVHLAMVGDGHLIDELKARAVRLGVGDRVTLHGPFPRGDLRSVYEDADLFAFPSTFDTQGFVINEAAHEALPLLVADDINPVIQHGESAIVVDHDPASFAAGFEVLADGALRRRLGDHAQFLAGQNTEAGQVIKLAELLRRAAHPRFALPAEPLPLRRLEPVERDEVLEDVTAAALIRDAS